METITDGKWLWYDAMSDLKTHGCEVTINPLTVGPHHMSGECEGVFFVVTWVKDKIMLVTTESHKRKLVDALSDVVEYLPFAMYTDENGFTFEWDKVDPEGRWNDLQDRDGLVRL